MSTILLVEDDTELREALKKLLERDYSVTAVSSIAQAQAEVERTEFQLALLDWELPDGEGIELCDLFQRSERLKGVPVIFLTGRALIDDKEKAFAIGADDYIVKPFESRELRARIKAKLAKADRLNAGEYRFHALRFQVTTQTAHLHKPGNTEYALDLTPVEFRLLLYFAQNPEKVLTREVLMQHVWGNQVHVLDRTVDTHISHLRAKLANTGYTIKAVPRKGYRLVTPLS